MATVTRVFELSPEASAALDQRANLEARSAADLLNDMLLNQDQSAFAELSPAEWAALNEGLEDERSGRFASRDEVESVFREFRPK